MTSLTERLAAEAEAAEQAEAMTDQNAPLPEGTKVTRGHGRSSVLQIRLNCDEVDELERLAKSQQLPISTVARRLIMTALEPSDSTSAVISRLETNIAALKRTVAQQ